MKRTIPDEIKSKLETTIQKSGKRSESTQSRLVNICWIENLSRKGLSYDKKERQLLMYTTQSKEKIFIQYPGKESRGYTKNGIERKKTAIRPWDFRPRLYSPGNKEPHTDMSFGAMWATIFETANKITGSNRKEILRVFATLLYRMAFMLDHTKVDVFDTQERDVIYKKDDSYRFSAEKENRFPGLFKYNPDRQVLAYVAKNCPRWGEMSLEAFLFYNELLVWNEDCKYHYKEQVKDTNWQRGRVNTLLSHIRILGYMLGKVLLSDIFDGFARQQGISPASKEEVIRICGDFIKAG